MINSKLRGIGEMTELSIDTKKKRVRVRLELVGEKESIDVEIIRYSLKVKGESTYMTIEEATSSRQWVTVALREFIVGQDLAVPAKAVAFLQLLT
jgi:HSP20 family molecular chaperone IbpA